MHINLLYNPFYLRGFDFANYANLTFFKFVSNPPGSRINRILVFVKNKPSRNTYNILKKKIGSKTKVFLQYTFYNNNTTYIINKDLKQKYYKINL